jgi:hypothetical protein
MHLQTFSITFRGNRRDAFVLLHWEGSFIQGSVMSAGPVHDIVCPHDTRLPGDLPPAAKQDQGWQTVNGVAGGKRRLGFGIHLGESHGRFQLGSRLLEGGGHLPAVAAPGSPEVHQNGDVGPLDVFGESCRGQFHGTGIEERPMAFAAPGLLLLSAGR